MGFVNRTKGTLMTLASLRKYVKISRYSVSALQSNAYAEMLGKGSTLLRRRGIFCVFSIIDEENITY
jgi:hypothetical protein